VARKATNAVEAVLAVSPTTSGNTAAFRTRRFYSFVHQESVPLSMDDEEYRQGVSIRFGAGKRKAGANRRGNKIMNGDEIVWKEPGGKNGALAKLNPQWFAEIKEVDESIFVSTDEMFRKSRAELRELREKMRQMIPAGPAPGRSSPTSILFSKPSQRLWVQIPTWTKEVLEVQSLHGAFNNASLGVRWFAGWRDVFSPIRLCPNRKSTALG
jgi:hypothetical protein